ncbi:MAG: hypothetical protein WCK15_12400, partial [Pirellula sp.]
PITKKAKIAIHRPTLTLRCISTSSFELELLLFASLSEQADNTTRRFLDGSRVVVALRHFAIEKGPQNRKSVTKGKHHFSLDA